METTLRVPTKLSKRWRVTTSALSERTRTQDPSSLAFHPTQILIRYPAWIYSVLDFKKGRQRMIPEETFGSYTSGLFRFQDFIILGNLLSRPPILHLEGKTT